MQQWVKTNLVAISSLVFALAATYETKTNSSAILSSKVDFIQDTLDDRKDEIELTKSNQQKVEELFGKFKVHDLKLDSLNDLHVVVTGLKFANTNQQSIVNNHTSALLQLNEKLNQQRTDIAVSIATVERLNITLDKLDVTLDGINPLISIMDVEIKTIKNELSDIKGKLR